MTAETWNWTEGTTMPELSSSEVIETWDMLTEATVWVWVKDARTSSMVKKRIGGRAGGTKVLHLTTDERRYNQEQVVEENKDDDPFTNGSLKLRSVGVADDIDTTYHLTNEDLRAMLSIRDQDVFESEVREISSELILRRLKDIAENEATIGQYTFLRDLVDERYKSGGTQATVREMLEEEARQAGTVLR
jgi:bifunctional DNA-binding transcriptional regulator/antitoxin component of YhaV-PrlF toxin-antitoxin module